jgi:hypothetical protein
MTPSRILVSLAVLGLPASAMAGDFVTLPLAATGQPATTVNGAQIQFVDPLNIAETPANPPRPNGSLNQFDLPARFTVLHTRTSTVTLDGSLIGQAAGVPFNVGTMTDQVLRDSNNEIVLAVRVVLDDTVAGVQNVYEINNILRKGFTGHRADAAWTRASSRDIRMFNAARSATLFPALNRLSDPDVVITQTDINVSETNPWGSVFLFRTNAPYCGFSNTAIDLYQGGEEGQPLGLVTLPGYIPLDDRDTDGDGIPDGEEDANCNGIVDPGETDPNVPDNGSEPVNVPLPLGAPVALAVLGGWMAVRRLRRQPRG